MKIVISGTCPSLKNAKVISVNSKTGKRFVRTEDRVKNWMDGAKLEVKSQWKREPLDKLDNLTCVFYNSDKRAHDLSNQLDSICDVIKGTIVSDDTQFCMPSIQVQYGGVSKDPRTELWVDFENGTL